VTIHSVSALLGSSLLVSLLCEPLAAATPDTSADAQSRPDFTGVWQLASRPMTSAQGYPEVPLTAAGQE